MVNILISAYNGEQYIEEQLESIKKQTYDDYRIIIRDDGSTDRTVEVVKRYIEGNKLQDKVILKQGENVGFCKSFFELLLMAEEGDYWAFCDQDDVWYEDKLKRAVAWMEQQNDHDRVPLLYHSGIEIGNADLSIRKKDPIKRKQFQFYNSITGNIFYGFASTINRALYALLVQADPSKIKYHDWFAAMLATAFGRYHVSSCVTAVHRLHGGNESPDSFIKKIPRGIQLLKGDLFYTENAREFMRLYGDMLNEKDYEILSWFTNKNASLKNSVKKAFYRKRWNSRLEVELILRILMLLGKI